MFCEDNPLDKDAKMEEKLKTDENSAHPEGKSNSNPGSLQAKEIKSNASELVNGFFFFFFFFSQHLFKKHLNLKDLHVKCCQ